MRASTVFAIALSLLIALAAAAGAKYAGLFDKKPAPPAGEKAAPIKVLVATISLYEDITVTAEQVMVRDIRPEEQRFLEERYGKDQWQSKLMPPLVTAAHLRVARFNILADQVLLREFFTDPTLPQALPDRLEKNTRAVNVSVPKEKAAGGAIRLGEYVDVLLTTKVWDNSKDREELRTAVIAKACKVIMKRNNPWTVMAADPDDKPLNFTLQANAYRAALIDYAQTYGQLSLQPVQKPAASPPGSFSDPASKEYANEDQRVEELMRGELTIGDKDLVRIYQLPPPLPKAPTPQPQVVEHYVGVAPAGKTVFYPPISTPAPAAPAQTPPDTQPKAPATQPGNGMGAAGGATDLSGNYTFRVPSATGSLSGSNCPTCDAQKKKQQEEQQRQQRGTAAVVGGR